MGLHAVKFFLRDFKNGAVLEAAGEIKRCTTADKIRFL